MLAERLRVLEQIYQIMLSLLLEIVVLHLLLEQVTYSIIRLTQKSINEVRDIWIIKEQVIKLRYKP